MNFPAVSSFPLSKPPPRPQRRGARGGLPLSLSVMQVGYKRSPASSSDVRYPPSLFLSHGTKIEYGNEKWKAHSHLIFCLYSY